MLQPRHAALLLWSAASSMLVIGQFYAAIPYIDAVAEHFHISGTRAALVVSSFGFAYAPGMIVWGLASDKWGRVKVLVAGMMATAVFTALAALTTHFGWLLAARALQGFAASSFSPNAVSLLAEQLPQRSRPLGMSVIGFAFLLSAPVVQYGAVASGASFSAVLFVSAPLFLLSATAVRTIVAAPPTASDVIADSNGRLTPLLQDRVIIAAWTAATTVLFGFASFQAAAQIIPTLVARDVMFTPEQIRLVGMPALLAAFIAPRVTLRCGPVTTATLGFVIAAAAFILAQVGFPRTLTAASIIICAGTAIAVPSLMGTVASRAQTANRGLALGIYTCILFIGASAAPLAMHTLAPSTTAMFSLPAAALTAAALLLAAARRSAAAPTPTDHTTHEYVGNEQRRSGRTTSR